MWSRTLSRFGSGTLQEQQVGRHAVLRAARRGLEHHLVVVLVGEPPPEQLRPPPPERARVGAVHADRLPSKSHGPRSTQRLRQERDRGPRTYLAQVGLVHGSDLPAWDGGREDLETRRGRRWRLTVDRRGAGSSPHPRRGVGASHGRAGRMQPVTPPGAVPERQGSRRCRGVGHGGGRSRSRAARRCARAAEAGPPPRGRWADGRPRGAGRSAAWRCGPASSDRCARSGSPERVDADRRRATAEPASHGVRRARWPRRVSPARRVRRAPTGARWEDVTRSSGGGPPRTAVERAQSIHDTSPSVRLGWDTAGPGGPDVPASRAVRTGRCTGPTCWAARPGSGRLLEAVADRRSTATPASTRPSGTRRRPGRLRHDRARARRRGFAGDRPAPGRGSRGWGPAPRSSPRQAGGARRDRP